MDSIFAQGTNRKVVCMDANKWMEGERGKGNKYKAIITSLPDMQETNQSIQGWKIWVKEVCTNIMNILDEDGVIIFYQTDRKYKGTIIDKKSIISNEFYSNGFQTILSTIALRQKPETINLFRPSYSNLFGFSETVKTGKIDKGDVIYAGKSLYKNAMGFTACKTAIEFVQKRVPVDTIVDPFCGQGSVLKIANEMGLNSFGIDISEKQAKKARK